MNVIDMGDFDNMTRHEAFRKHRSNLRSQMLLVGLSSADTDEILDVGLQAFREAIVAINRVVGAAGKPYISAAAALDALDLARVFADVVEQSDGSQIAAHAIKAHQAGEMKP